MLDWAKLAVWNAGISWWRLQSDGTRELVITRFALMEKQEAE